ncbi:ABC transporter [Parashewanella spongiae]|uniref:ABC transporter n=1 Tax=Parashewanella spongiae TaxID=342950 RepID=A0A3A6TFT0_9GAMM|nr:lipocalin-like domain-containing protein [Parashewanella spongiae]MCL1079306.1 ABC transporter [Parashewanella spongiae]RJY10513.1 ABC transporter [Parashewanella spongiae]
MTKCALLLLSILLLLSCEPLPKTNNSQTLQIVSGVPVDRNRGVIFPQDHGPHLDQGIEWWYITANLTAETGERFGAQWTMFRTLVPLPFESTWWDNQLYFAHFALQHEQSHVAFERFARAGQASITISPFIAQLDDWSLESTQKDFLPLQMKASQDDYAIDVSLSHSPLILHGENGYSQKTDKGHASYYFSYPFLETNGTVLFNGKKYSVSGNAWYDREWSASLLDKSQLGWDWFNLVTEDKQGLMLFCIRDAEQNYDYCSGTRVTKNGHTTHIPREYIKLHAMEHVFIDGTKYPSQWKIELPDSEPILIKTITKDSINKLSIKYWEGRVISTGGFNGIGYAELAGY